MTIPLTPDADDMPRWMPPEHCCFCAAKTRMWYKPRDVAVCTDCAETRDPSEVPTKTEWCESPQGQGIAPVPDVPAMIEVARLEFQYARVSCLVAADGSHAHIRSIELRSDGTESLVEEETTDKIGSASYSLFHDACTNALSKYTTSEWREGLTSRGVNI